MCGGFSISNQLRCSSCLFGVAQPHDFNNMKALVIRIMYTKFGKNWLSTFRGDVKNLISKKLTKPEEVHGRIGKAHLS